MTAITKRSSKEDVIAYITGVMGLVAPEGTKDDLFAFIEENGGTIGSSAPDLEKEKVSGNVDAASGINMSDRVKIRITKTEDSRGSDDVFVGCNGAGFLIKRGVTVEVPRAVAEGLRNAVTKKLVEVVNDSGDHTGAFEYIDVQSYPFEVLS
jgi:hypothetical protein